MSQTPKIVRTETKYIACYSTKTSLNNNQVANMWKAFMPIRNKIPERAGPVLYAIHSYPPDFRMRDFTSDTEYTSRAGIEVSTYGIWPEKLERFVLPAGLYAIFIYKGTVANFYRMASYIFGEWLPNSAFEEDNSRPHYEMLDHLYLGPENPESVEKVYVPIKKKAI